MYFKKIFIAVFFLQALVANNIEITSDSMKAEDLTKEVHFIGNAKIKQQGDWLYADHITVYFDDNNETKMYKAQGSVTFEFKSQIHHYEGSANNIVYHPIKLLYVLTGDVKVNDLLNGRHLRGHEVLLNKITGKATVKGKNKMPVKFIFDLKES